MMLTHRTLLAVAAAAAGAFLASPAAVASTAESQQIDRLVETDLLRNQLKPLPPSTDEEFLRRIYLDIIGRIPTAAEAKEFLDHEAPNKRALLINKLLDSEGYVSHTTNWWSDVLRIKTQGEAEQSATGPAYREWVKNAVRENMPYDQFVKELINPSIIDDDGERKTGVPVFSWENGAVGYYMRDKGMPLDNMSNTVQVFLGTRLVCAQCHDHPFDKWSQMDYHQMAAYTYNSIDTNVRPAEILGIEEDVMRANRREEDSYLRDALGDLFRPITDNGVMPIDRKLQLPHDYRSDKSPADPYEEVSPTTRGFDGKSAGRGHGSRLLDNYAEWLTSDENPRFSKVIANRLWKRVMGRGLVEPVDDWMDTTEPSNRYALDYLTRLMEQKEFDTKEVLRVLFNTRTYQRQAYGDDIPEDTAYHFQGPVLRRMTAEQIWDSFLTIAVPDIDERRSNIGRPEYQGTDSEDYAQKLLAMNGRDVLRLAKQVADLRREYEPKIRSARQELSSGGNATEIQNRITKLTEEMESRISEVRRTAFTSTGDDSSMMMSENRPAMMESEKEKEEAAGGSAEDRWASYDRSLMRASELQSPTDPGHFLRQFGQSDRDVIENANSDPSVDQALTLLNSPIFETMFNDKSKLALDLETAATQEEKENLIFLGLLSRYPSEKDRELMRAQVEQYGEDKAIRNIAWALVNTQEFVFLQ